MPSPVIADTGSSGAAASAVFCQQRVHLRGDFRLARRGQIRLGQRHHAAIDAQQLQDLHVLARLRHDAIVQRHHQQRRIDAAGAGEHRVHEALMARHIDEAERIGIGVAEIDGDAAPLLLGQAIGIDAGQRLHQRGLAVIDVTGGADDHGRRGTFSPRKHTRQEIRQVAVGLSTHCIVPPDRIGPTGGAQPQDDLAQEGARHRQERVQIAHGAVALNTKSTSAKLSPDQSPFHTAIPLVDGPWIHDDLHMATARPQIVRGLLAPIRLHKLVFRSVQHQQRRPGGAVIDEACNARCVVSHMTREAPPIRSQGVGNLHIAWHTGLPCRRS